MNAKTTATAFSKMFAELEQIDFYEQQADELMNDLEEMSEHMPPPDLKTFEGQFRYKLNLWAEALEQQLNYYKRLSGVTK